VSIFQKVESAEPRRNGPAMHILIVKHGALGDVVRTSYFARPLRDKLGPGLRLSWITAPTSLPLLRFHPAIDDLWTSFDQARPHVFDHIYSLDDETDVLVGVAGLRSRGLTGATIDAQGAKSYTDNAAEWFDMGLLSRHGKARADELKKLNTRTHAEIHTRMLDVAGPAAEFYGDVAMEMWAREWIGARHPVIGVSPFAGGRWPSKELRAEELAKLVGALRAGRSDLGDCDVVLLGAGTDRERNLMLAREFRDDRLRVANTDDSLLRLAAVVRELDYMISSDSLAMHLAIAQRIPTVAFFAPTSGIEIDHFGRVEKVLSTAPDYCSYRKDADNSNITAERLLESLQLVLTSTGGRT
jgi:heptosyltransferase-2